MAISSTLGFGTVTVLGDPVCVSDYNIDDVVLVNSAVIAQPLILETSDAIEYPGTHDWTI